MRILFDLGHPAHVHLFKHVIRNLERDNHTVLICVRERENIVGDLLREYGFPYLQLESNARGLLRKAITMVKNDYKLLKIAKNFNPDVFVSHSSPYAAQVSAIMRKHSITFTDTDTATLILALTVPFTDSIITPERFMRDLGKKQIRIKGYKELAYLHPNRYEPDHTILDLLGVSESEKYVVLRFSAFDASHDVGVSGFTLDTKRRLVEALEPYARVFILSETALPADLKHYALKIPPHKIHDVLYYASLVVGDAGTMATEAAILGTPAIVSHPLSSKVNTLVELENDYQLIHNITEQNNVIKKAVELIQSSSIKQEWRQKGRKLLDYKIDVTSFFTWFIENYPGSADLMKEDSDLQDSFQSGGSL